MAKDKSKKGVPNKHLHSRIAFLHEATKYLTEQSLRHSNGDASHEEDTEAQRNAPNKAVGQKETKVKDPTLPLEGNQTSFNSPPSGLPLALSFHLRSVAHKGQIRLSTETKHSICKVCDSPLIEGSTCKTFSENHSKGGRKPWAEVSVVQCLACGGTKRFPVGAKRQKRKGLRAPNGKGKGNAVREVAEELSTVETTND